MKLIDKDALVAEIKRQLAFYLKEIEDNKEDPWAMDIAKRDILQEVLSFIDTLEVKEVDLEKPFEGIKVQTSMESGSLDEIILTTKYKAQKGESV